jgi:ribosomal protein S18 acetylase RimI-like enzyme
MTPDPARGGVELRPAAANDAAEIADVYLASFKATYDFPLAHTDDQVRRWIAEILLPTHEVWVAADAKGSIVGMMALSADMLDQLYVAPSQTGRAIGSRLVELAKRRRPAGLDLYTFQVNRNARRFYERRGFGQVQLGDGSANEEGQPDVRYAWRSPTAMATADQIAQDHVAAFNDAVASGTFSDFLTRFSDDAVMRFENVPGAGTHEFAGRAAIASAYREQPPDDQIDIAGEARDEGGSIAIPFTWRRDRSPGVMRITRDRGRISRMAVLFGSHPGLP